MKILALHIERSLDSDTFCGTLDYADHAREGTLLWTVDAHPLKIDVAFVQGSDEAWDEIAREHASRFSDRVILEIARRRGLPALTASRLDPV